MSAFSLDFTLKRYRTTLEQLAQAIAQSKAPDALLPYVLEVMATRDTLHRQLHSDTPLSGKTLIEVTCLDHHLKQSAGAIAQCLKDVDWQTSFCPSDQAWWWSIQPKKSNPWWNQDWLWKAVSVTCITVSIGLFGDVSTRLLKDGPDAFSAIAVSAQSVGTLLAAGGALTLAGQEANKRLLKRFKVPEQYWPEVGAGVSLLLLLSAVGLRQSLPQLATLYSNCGFQHYKEGNWGTAEVDYKRALSLNSDDDETALRLGLLYEELQDTAQAKTYYQRAAQAGIPDAINNLSRLNLLDKKPTNATPLLMQALEDEKKLPVNTRYAMLKNLGWARLQQQDYADAAFYLKAAIDLQTTAKLPEQATDPKNNTTLAIASPYCLLAQVKEAQNQAKAALTDWSNCNATANPYIVEENAWAITARQKLKGQDRK